jgi:hypothetical protein
MTTNRLNIKHNTKKIKTMSLQQQVAEEATGCVENPFGIGTYYEGAKNIKGMVTPGGDVIESKEATYTLLMEGVEVEVPNAGAGSYHTFFRSVGFGEVEIFQDSSSAGDWEFGVKDGDLWYPAFQRNRFPYHGFAYSVDFNVAFASFDAMCEFYH